MEQLKNTGTIETITSQALATRMRITPKRLRAILRAEFQRDGKGKKWEIPLDVAKKVEKAYKAKAKAIEQKHKAKNDEESKSG